MSEQRQDTTTGQSTSGTVHQPSENASNTSKTAPKTAEEIHKLPSEELVDLLRRTYIECRDEEMTGDEYGVDLNHPSYATFLLAQTEMQNRKTLRVGQGGAVLDIHAR